MRKFIKNILSFGSLLILILVFISRYDDFDKKTNSDENIIRIQKKSCFDNLDILFVGNSYCYSGIIPSYFDEIGLKTFNLGIASAGPYFYELITNDYLEHTSAKPKLIFILLSPIIFSRLADNFEAYPIHRYLESPKTNEEIVFQYGITKQYIKLFIKSVSKGVKNILSSSSTNKSNLIFETKGWFASNSINSEKKVMLTKQFYTPLKNENFNQQYYNYLKKIVKNLELKDIKIVFFELPDNLLENYFTTQYLFSYKKAIENFKSDHIFFSSDLKLGNDYFRNIDHLNERGAKIVTKDLIRKIKTEARLASYLNIKN